jgi:hypothetical protein
MIVTHAIQKRRARVRGYTVVEIMSAMTLFAIGAAGVVGMERVTIQGGFDARRFDTATNIAREWEHRLQRDSAFWTEPNSVNTGNINLNKTLWLNNVGAGWISPPPSPNGTPLVGTSPAFDILGHDLAPGSADQMYCAQYRLTWIADPGTGAPFKPTALMKAEVRVFWSRLEKAPAACDNPDPTPDDATAQNTYFFVYTATAIRENPDQ